LLVREALAERGFDSRAKTSGKSGIHVEAGLPGGYTFPRVRELLEEIGRGLDRKHPETFALEERIKTRQGMIYFDYNQNGYGSTITAGYSIRPTPTATISMPLTWDGVERCPDPLSFTVRSRL
jgi:bifunctional non-homologous end joining protein LigD